MKKYISALKTILLIAGIMPVVMISYAYSAVVNENEATSIADQWYAMELNSGYLKISEEERTDRFKKLAARKLYYLTDTNNLSDIRPSKGKVLAYVIVYEPSGYVIVSGEDRIEPIIVFDVESLFRWDEPRKNFLRHFIGKEMPKRWKYVKDKEAKGEKVGVHPNWTKLREKLKKQKLKDTTFDMPRSAQDSGGAPQAPSGSTFVLWDTALWDQLWPYNTEVEINNGNIPGIPTGCTATAMAIIMRFHEWPLTGYGWHSYTDSQGAIQFYHYANFGAHTYNWANMPTTNLTSANQDVAVLMYHAGVAVDMDYGVGFSGAWPTAATMNAFFRYKGTDQLNFGHETAMRDSIVGGLPVIISSSVHTVVADGYRSVGPYYYHMNPGYGGLNNGWYSLSNMPGGDPTVDMSYPYSSPNNYVYVDGVIHPGANGTIQQPYETVSQGYTAVPAGGHLWIKTGVYTGPGNSPINFTKQMVVTSYEGEVVIGQ